MYVPSTHIYGSTKDMELRIQGSFTIYWFSLCEISSVNVSKPYIRKVSSHASSFDRFRVASVRLQNLPWYKTGLVSRQVL